MSEPIMPWRQLFVRGAPLLVLASVLGGCDEAPRRAASAEGTGYGSTVPRPEGTAVTPEVRTRWAELVGRQLPTSFADADEERFYARCLEFTKALHDKAAVLEERSENQSRDPTEPPALLRAVEAVRSSPPRMPAEDVAWCSAYTIKSLKAQLGATVARQAEATLQAMAGAMVVAHERTGKLCPSTAKPVPAELKLVTHGPFEPDVKAWDDPAWRCLRFRWLRPLRFQYELKSQADRFELIARGSPAADGRIDEYRLAGKIVDGKLELGAATGRFLTE